MTRRADECKDCKAQVERTIWGRCAVCADKAWKAETWPYCRLIQDRPMLPGDGEGTR